MANRRIMLALPDANLASALDRNVLRPAGYDATWLDSLHAAESLVATLRPEIVLVGDELVDGDFRQFSAYLRQAHPAIPMILFPRQAGDQWALEALHHGFVDCLLPPLNPDKIIRALERALERGQEWARWTQKEALHSTDRLRRRLDELETLSRIGQSVTSHLDLDRVLTTIVEAAVDLTGAEEGSLLLLDEESGELYMRAARNFQDEFVRTFRLPIQDTLAGQVVQSGMPVVVDDGTPQKIKTAYLVHALIYVPIKLQDQVIGVLGVDNRTSGHSFDERHRTLMAAVADYAAIAIENARLYARTDVERKKLETILDQIDDGVIVFDLEDRLLLINRAARRALNLEESAQYNGQPFLGWEPMVDLAEALNGVGDDAPYPAELEVEDGRVFNLQTARIPDVGRAITLQDVTHFKELDQLKNDFVHTVSHDLRTPLTAILGYLGLIERAGPINEQQLEYIGRVQSSAETVTELVNKLLDLGRIEAGFDRYREKVSLVELLEKSIEGLRHHVDQKGQNLVLECPADLPGVHGHPIRLRQLFDNLLDNAVKYTPAQGEIHVRARNEGDQVIIQVKDTGMGIPPGDQPYIFDKLYRASNVPPKTAGTGLGLSIVKSIVESHQGRIWAESTPGVGSTFTVVLPVNSEA